MYLSETQSIFTDCFAKLIFWANLQDGVRVRINEVTRTKDQQILYYTGKQIVLDKGKAKITDGIVRSSVLRSAHNDRRAGDLILDRLINDKWVYQRDTEAYRFLGKFWKMLHPNNIWGGDWEKFPDGNHFETRML